MNDRADANRFVVTGAAGFLGSHLCEALLRRGHLVIGIDDLSSGRSGNLAGFARHPGFIFREADVLDGLPVHGPVDGVFHLIAPTPATRRPEGQGCRLPPLPTGIDVVTEFARRRHARLLLVATAGEEYEDPFEHVAPGPLEDPVVSALDDVRVARLFHAYGPRMEPEDEPVLMRLLLQAITGQPMVVTDPAESRSFCFVSDMVNGMLRLFRSNLVARPVDLGDPQTHRMQDVVQAIQHATTSVVPVEHREGRAERLRQVLPDTTAATERLGWAPRVPLGSGIATTATWLRGELGPTVGHRDAAQLRTA